MKSKLTPQIQEKMGENIVSGLSLKNAAIAAGISETTFFRWMQQGEKATSGTYRQFWEYIKKAEVESEKTHLDIITAAAEAGTWQASAWILERRFPDEWGRKDRVDMKAEHMGQTIVKFDVKSFEREK